MTDLPATDPREPLQGAVAPTEPAAAPTSAMPLSLGQRNRQRDGVSDAMLESMRQTFINAGLDPALVDAEYVTGTTVAPVEKPAGTPQPGQVVAPVDTTGRTYQPEAYRLDLQALNLLHEPIEVVAEAQSTWAEFLSAGGVNPAVGVGVIEHASRTSREVAAMSDAERGLWEMDQEASLLQHAGSPEAVQAIRNDVGYLITHAFDHGDKLAVAKAVDALRQSGASKDWFVLRTLAAQAQALRATLA